MIGSARVWSVIFIAVLAMFAPVVGEAHAQPGIFTAGATPDTHEDGTVVGEQYDPESEAWNFLEVGGQQLRCHEALFSSTIDDGTATSLTVAPEYRRCDFGANPATVTTNGCDFTLAQPQTFEGGGSSYTGKALLNCPESKRIVAHVFAFGSSTESSHFFSACTVEAYPGKGESQEFGGHVVYASGKAEGRDDLTVEVDLSGITATSNCPEGGHTAEARYKATITIAATSDPAEGPHEETRDLWIGDLSPAFTAGSTPETNEDALIGGEQYDAESEAWNFLEVGERQLRCDKVQFDGTVDGGVGTSLTITPEYRHCTMDGQPVTVTTNGCDFTLTQPQTFEGGGSSYTGKSFLRCPESKRIAIDVYGFGNATDTSHFFLACTVEVHPAEGESQELGGHVVYAPGSLLGRDDLTLKVDLNGITGDSSACPEGEHSASAVYKATATLAAASDPEEELRDLWIGEEEEAEEE